jgi:hypothetical protein
MNWAGKKIVEFFSVAISAIVCKVRSCLLSDTSLGDFAGAGKLRVIEPG